MASGCRNHCHAKSLEYSTLCVCDYGSREYISEIHQTLWSLITKPIMAFKFPILFSSRLLWQSGCLTVHVASLCCGALTSAWVQVSCKFNSYLTLLLLLNQRLPCSSSVATYIPHSAALIQLSFTQFSSLPPSHPHVQWELWCCSPDPAFIVRCPPYGSLKEKVCWPISVPLSSLRNWCIYSSTADPLVSYGHHFGRTVHTLANIKALITNGILCLGELADEPEESFTTE